MVSTYVGVILSLSLSCGSDHLSSLNVFKFLSKLWLHHLLFSCVRSLFEPFIFFSSFSVSASLPHGQLPHDFSYVISLQISFSNGLYLFVCPFSLPAARMFVTVLMSVSLSTSQSVCLSVCVIFRRLYVCLITVYPLSLLVFVLTQYFFLCLFLFVCAFG